jgi:hypothetical protein
MRGAVAHKNQMPGRRNARRAFLFLFASRPFTAAAKTEALRLIGLVSVIAQAKRPRKKAERNPPIWSMVWTPRPLLWLQKLKTSAQRCDRGFFVCPEGLSTSAAVDFVDLS